MPLLPDTLERAPPSSESPGKFSIPKASFTAFRLTHALAKEVSELATTVFLGRIPDVWIGGPQIGILFGSTARARKAVNRKFKSASGTISNSVQWFTPPKPPPLEGKLAKGDEEYDFSLFNSENRIMEQKLAEAYKVVDNEETDHAASDNDDSSVETIHSHDTSAESSLHPASFAFNSQVYGLHSPSTGSWDSSTESLGSFSPAPRGSANFTHAEPHQLVPDPNQTLQAQDIPENVEIRVFSPENGVSNVPQSNATLAFPSRLSIHTTSNLNAGRVTFDLDIPSSKRSSRITFTNPEPELDDVQGMLDRQYVKAEREHTKMMKKLRQFTSKSKGLAKNKGHRLKLKVKATILSSYKPGELIRVDRMLVMIEKASSKHVPFVHDNDPPETRLVDRWKEYLVVLRKSEELSLEIQFFEGSQVFDSKRKPEYAINLNDRINADFHSSSDKTIRITKKDKDDIVYYILNARYTSVAFKWLFIIRDILYGDYATVVDVQVGGLDMQFKIGIPMELIRKSMTPEKYIELSEDEHGYTVARGEILDYLKRELLISLQRIRRNHKQVEEWLEKNFQPWFCFKFYDRLEWAPASSRAFFMQNRLQSKFSNLVFRQVTRTRMVIQNQDCQDLKRPYPVEGFLARVTNMSGAEYSNLRAFYRIQYFFTAEGILFFTQIYKGTPPSPGNAFMDENADREEVRKRLPERYLKLPFSLDGSGHIPWLNTPSFNQHDQEAVEEFERQVELVIKSDAMIDLCAVRQVKPISPNDILRHHKYLHSFLWYSSTQIIEEEEIIDCGFEIVILNGKRLKLLAPSRNVRDEWVKLLSAQAEFWKNVKLSNVISKIEVRKYNRERLGINEYSDSNMSRDKKGLETHLSIGNDQIFNTSSLAMATCVLETAYLYIKHKKHANFSKYFVVLSPGYMVIFTLFQRSKISGAWKKTAYFKHYLTIPLGQCYVYSGDATWYDLVESSNDAEPGKNDIPRSYPDGWKSSEEDAQRCFTLWLGHKRRIKKDSIALSDCRRSMGADAAKNPGMTKMFKKFGFGAKKIVFLTKSRQEREEWVYKILLEMNRFSGTGTT